ncbi:MAG: hypothetical protein CMD23_00945 [Flavobacteriales bacterium]|nr:hypothetical protein [Flavobacteriales bacterium]
MNKYLFILFIPFMCYSQDEKLRIETINVFKEFQPKISNSKKIGEQPIFNDTLSVNVVPSQSILNKKLELKETTLYKSPSKFRMNKLNNDFQQYFSITTGSHTFLKTKFHYNTGLSVLHNSGIYLEHTSEDYGLQSPYYKHLNGELKNTIKLYSNRFFNDKLLEISSQFYRQSGLYWGGLEAFSVDSISNFIGDLFNIEANLKQISNAKFLKSINLELHSFSHNHGRKELFFNSALNFELEKALRKYSFSLSYSISNTSLSPDWVLMNNSLLFKPEILSGFHLDKMSDRVVKSKFLISGTKLINYAVGVDLQYYSLSDFNVDAEYDDINYLIFPTIKLFKNLNNNQRIEFLIEKDFKYPSFISLFDDISYLDPYYRNAIEKEMKAALIYNTAFSENLSLFSSVRYNVIKNKLIPFLLSSETGYSSLFAQNSQLMHPLSFYASDFSGIVASGSFSFSKNQYDFLMSGTVNMLHSSEHIDRSILPLIELNSMLTVNLFENFDISSCLYFVGERDALRIPSLLASNSNLTYVHLASYSNLSVSMKYALKNMFFSIDFNNLLGQKMDFFDGYYDDDRFKFRLGFVYNF